jgi:hypothetical protein
MMVRCGVRSCRCARGQRHGWYPVLRWRKWDPDGHRWHHVAEYLHRDDVERVRQLIEPDRRRSRTNRLAALLVVGMVGPRDEKGRFVGGWGALFSGGRRSRGPVHPTPGERAGAVAASL